jgi:hypothetical protein
MKFKYVLRGLGIGIVVTAAVMGAYTRYAVADARAQARVDVLQEYGFGEEATLVENETESEDITTQTQTEVDTLDRDSAIESEIESAIELAKAAETATETEVVTETEAESEVEVAAETEKESKSSEEKSVPDFIASSDVATTSQAEAPETIDITVAGGDDSSKVSRKLYNAGIIDSATDFDAFLMQHGYDKRITVGTKTINITDSWQEIAEKLTNK